MFLSNSGEMKAPITGTEAKTADRYAMDTLGMESLALMETASRKVANYIISHSAEQMVSSIMVLAGVGNNGADAVCAAQMLLNAGFSPSIYVIGNLLRASWEFLYQMAEFQRQGGKVVFYEEGMKCDDTAILIDGIFGIGLHRPITGKYQHFIEAVNRAKHAFTLAIDVPSGINADTGELMGCGIHADITITFGRNKIGLLNGEGQNYAGQVIVEDIGLPDEIYAKLIMERKS